MTARETLKVSILDYLTGTIGITGKQELINAVNRIKDAAFDVESVVHCEQRVQAYAKGLRIKPDEEFYPTLSWSFAPEHYWAIVGFVKQYEQILEEECDKESA